VQSPPGQFGIGGHPLAQVAAERVEQRAPGLARAVDRRLQAALDVLAHVLRSSPVGRAIADTDRPWRCRSRIMTISPSRPTSAAPVQDESSIGGPGPADSG
jgi:hypothetical protein